jgi:hypothetical protein
MKGRSLRTLLQHFTMHYHGRTGMVMLSNDTVTVPSASLLLSKARNNAAIERLALAVC